MAKIEEEIGRGCDCRDSSNWADKYWGLSDDRSRLSGHGDSKNSAVRPQGLKKSTSPASWRSEMRFRRKTAGAGTARATLFGGHRGCRSAEALPRLGRRSGGRHLLPETADKTLPVLDRWADLIRRVNT
jgi:hypothetical protein